MVVNPGNPGASPISNGNGGGQRIPTICDDCMNEEFGIPNMRDVTVHAEGIYIFHTPGTYDVTIRQQQLAPNAIWPPQQAQIFQAVTPGNSFGQPAGAHQTPPNFAGGFGQAPFGGLGAAQYGARGGNGMTFAQPMLPITASGQPAHTPSSFSTLSSAPDFPMFSPQNLSLPDSDFDNSSLSPLSE